MHLLTHQYILVLSLPRSHTHAHTHAHTRTHTYMQGVSDQLTPQVQKAHRSLPRSPSKSVCEPTPFHSTANGMGLARKINNA